MAKDDDYYALLGLRPDASELEIRRAYRQRVLMFHPDRRPGDKEAEARFKQIAEAYSVLGARDRRAKYDASRVNEDVVAMARAATNPPAKAESIRRPRQEIRATSRGERFADGEKAAVLQATGTVRTFDGLLAVVVAAAGWEASRLLIANASEPSWLAAAAEGAAAAAGGTVAFRLALAADDNARYPLLAPGGAFLSVAGAVTAAALVSARHRGAADAAWLGVAAASAAVGSAIARSVGRAFLAEAASASGRAFARAVGAASGFLVAGATVAIPLGLAALAAFVGSVSDGMLHSGLVATAGATLCGALVGRDGR